MLIVLPTSTIPSVICMSQLSKLIVFAWFLKIGYRFWRGAYRYPWFCKKRNGRGTEEERKRKGKRKGKEKEEERKRRGKEKERKGKGKEKERKRKGKGMEKEKKRKGGGKGEIRKGVKAEEGKRGKEKGKDLFVVWSGAIFWTNGYR